MKRVRDKQLKSPGAEDLYRNIISSFIESAVRDGRIKTNGKSETEIQELYVKYLKHLSEDDVDFHIGWDHKSFLLKQARTYVVLSYPEIACFFYATWVEHWLNKTIRDVCIKRGLSETEISQIIRSTTIRDKITWLLKLINLPPIYQKHVKTILKLAELRNAFIHYKWRPLDEIKDEEEYEELQRYAANMVKTVRYFQNYERKILMNDKKGTINRFLKRIVKSSIEKTD